MLNAKYMAIKKDTPIDKIIPGNSQMCKDMIGKKFGRLTILDYLGYKISGKKYKAHLVEARCECGSVHDYIGRIVREGLSTSCGCFQAENSSKLHTKHGQKSPKHGKRGTILYARWRSMFDRVRSDDRYKNVKISDRWQGENGFVNFCSDMGEMPTPKHTVDRYPNFKGDYGPGNCRWATSREQMQNMSRNVYYEYKGERLCISEIARRVNIDSRELNKRLRRWNMTLSDAINYIPRKTRRIYKKKQL
jgi:hypothetical protein